MSIKHDDIEVLLVPYVADQDTREIIISSILERVRNADIEDLLEDMDKLAGR